MLPNQGGKFVPASASFPCLFPCLSSHLAAVIESTWSSPLIYHAAMLDFKAGSCLKVPPLPDRQSQLPGPLLQQLSFLEELAHF